MGLQNNRIPEETLAAFLEALAEHGVISRAADTAGCTTAAIRKIRQRNAEFRRRYDEAMEAALDTVEDAVMDAANSGLDMATSKWVLVRLRPDKWAERKDPTPPVPQDVVVRFSDGTPIFGEYAD